MGFLTVGVQLSLSLCLLLGPLFSYCIVSPSLICCLILLQLGISHLVEVPERPALSEAKRRSRLGIEEVGEMEEVGGRWREGGKTVVRM